MDVHRRFLIMKMRIIGIEDFSSSHQSMITLVLDAMIENHVCEARTSN